jgi:hypothetical protein
MPSTLGAHVRASIRTDRKDLPDPTSLRLPRNLVEQLLLAVEGPDVHPERPQSDGHAPDAGAQLEHRLGAERGRRRAAERLRAAQAHPQVEISGVLGVLDLAPSDRVAHRSNLSGQGPDAWQLWRKAIAFDHRGRADTRASEGHSAAPTYSTAGCTARTANPSAS